MSSPHLPRGRERERKPTRPQPLVGDDTGGDELDFVGFAARLAQVRFAQVFPFAFLVGDDERVRPRATVHTAVVDVATLPRIDAPPPDGDSRKPPLVLPLQRRGAGDEDLRIGRLPDNDLVVEDALISRVHARLRLAGELTWIRDAGSSNGTFVDEVRLAPQREELLIPGTHVRLGAIHLLYLDAVDCWSWLRARDPALIR